MWVYVCMYISLKCNTLKNAINKENTRVCQTDHQNTKIGSTLKYGLKYFK